MKPREKQRIVGTGELFKPNITLLALSQKRPQIKRKIKKIQHDRINRKTMNKLININLGKQD